MQEGRLKQKLHTGKPALGFTSYLGSEFAIETLGWVGFDFVMIDLEHCSIDESKMENLVRAAEVTGMNALIRVWEDDPVIVTKALDTGAMGLVFPFVNSAEDARKIVRWTRLASAGGSRGSCPASRVARDSYFRDGYAGYVKEAADPFILAMIETRSGLEAVHDIIATEHINGLYFGPADFSQSIGAAFNAKEVIEARNAVEKAALSAGKICMTVAFSPEDAVECFRRGVQLVKVAPDNFILANAGKEYVKQFNAAESAAVRERIK